MNILVNDATPTQLNWMVLACQKAELDCTLIPVNEIPDYSGDCNFGFPIICEQGIDTRQIKDSSFEIIDVRHYNKDKGDVIEFMNVYNREMVRRPKPAHPLQGKWMAKKSNGTGSTVLWSKKDCLSDTLLIAAMRCYVISVMGETVDIPEHVC